MDQKINPEPMHSEYVNNLPTDFTFFPNNMSDKDLEIIKDTCVGRFISAN